MSRITLKKIGIASAVLLLSFFIWKPWEMFTEAYRTTTVQKGTFETSIMVIGELKAQKALDITVPQISFNEEIDIWTLKILSLAEEGKMVEKGDEIARLEPTKVEEDLAAVNKKLDEYYSLLEDAKIDSSLTLADVRETIQKEKDRVLDTELKVEQSSFESKAIQRQVAIELEKAQRSLLKTQRNLIIRTQKHKIRIARNHRKINKLEHKKKLLEQLRSELSIKSPASGMVIYGIDDGQKVKVGTKVGRWMPLIATLPDLSTLISEIHVREIDIAKVKIGQAVNIKIEAFPKKVFGGTIVSIANIGQELPGEFQNGFKVIVQLNGFNEVLLPGMTTSNTVITSRQEESLFVAKESVSGNDTLKYVIKKRGFKMIRQEVLTGKENEAFFQIIKGLSANDKVLLELPENCDKLELVPL